jgi:hypothetical protein
LTDTDRSGSMDGPTSDPPSVALTHPTGEELQMTEDVRPDDDPGAAPAAEESADEVPPGPATEQPPAHVAEESSPPPAPDWWQHGGTGTEPPSA